MSSGLDWEKSGFIRENIRRFIISDCLESGSPVEYFMAMHDVMSDIVEEAVKMYPNHNDYIGATMGVLFKTSKYFEKVKP